MAKYVINLIENNNPYNIIFINKDFKLSGNLSEAMVLENKKEADKVLDRVKWAAKQCRREYEARTYKLAEKTLLERFRHDVEAITSTFKKYGLRKYTGG